MDGITPEPAYPVQQPDTIIEIRPYRGGWQCFEAPGVEPFWTGENAKQSAIDYAKGRAKLGRGEIRVLRPFGSVKRVIVQSNQPMSCLQADLA
jgi:hypothetical protein